MKSSTLLATLTLGAILAIGSTGCAHRPIPLTTIQDKNKVIQNPPRPIPDIPSGIAVAPQQPPPDSNPNQFGFGTADRGQRVKNGPHDEDRAKFAQDTVHFDTDSAVIKKEDYAKLQEVADAFKTDLKDALQIEGNCDERGTEKYNIGLGDRRALAVREFLANAGVPADAITTISFGYSKPVAKGHNESAWKQNRRAEIVLLIPK